MAGNKQPLGEILAQAAEKQPQEAAKPEKSLGAILKEVGGVIWDANKDVLGHGSAELASALFRGDAHVVYGWSDKDHSNEHVAAPHTPEAAKEVEKDQGLER